MLLKYCSDEFQNLFIISMSLVTKVKMTVSFPQWVIHKNLQRTMITNHPLTESLVRDITRIVVYYQHLRHGDKSLKCHSGDIEELYV